MRDTEDEFLLPRPDSLCLWPVTTTARELIESVIPERTNATGLTFCPLNHRWTVGLRPIRQSLQLARVIRDFPNDPHKRQPSLDNGDFDQNRRLSTHDDRIGLAEQVDALVAWCPFLMHVNRQANCSGRVYRVCWCVAPQESIGAQREAMTFVIGNKRGIHVIEVPEVLFEYNALIWELIERLIGSQEFAVLPSLVIALDARVAGDRVHEI